MSVKCACAECQMAFWLTDEFHTVARQTQMTFYCPAGHKNYYPRGDNEADRLRKERDRLKQNEAYLESRLREVRAEADTERRRSAAARGQVTKLKKRAAAGVCPCCNRTFTDLARHMAGQHPEFISQPDEASHVH